MQQYRVVGIVALSLLLSLGACGSGQSSLVPGYKDPGPSGWSETDKQLEIAVVAIVNKYRASGLDCGGTQMPPVDPVQMAPPLQLAARLHSADMVDQGYFSHTSKDGRSPAQRMKDAGATNLGAWGENIAAGSTTAEAVMKQWVGSSGHCKNFMSKSFKFIGLGKKNSTWTMTLSSNYQ